MARIKNKLAIFDIDGTLTDTVALHKTVFTEAVRFCGLLGGCFYTHYPPAERYTDLHILKNVFDESGLDLTLDEVDEFERLLLSLTQNKFNQIHQINGAIDFVKFLYKETDYAIAYATSSFKLIAELKLSIGFPINEKISLSACNAEPLLKNILGDAIERAKSTYAVEQFEKVIVFGDGRWDKQAAEHHLAEFIGIGAKIARSYRYYPPSVREKVFCFADYTELMTSDRSFNPNVAELLNRVVGREL